MTPAFSEKQIVDRIGQFAAQKKNDAVKALMYVGEQFVNDARSTRTYRDRTGNLRSSIGYAIADDGNIIKISLADAGNKPEGQRIGEQLARELAAKYNSGLVLIGFAGMEYAASVESRGYDVITGSVPLAEILKKSIGDALGL